MRACHICGCEEGVFVEQVLIESSQMKKDHKGVHFRPLFGHASIKPPFHWYQIGIKLVSIWYQIALFSLVMPASNCRSTSAHSGRAPSLPSHLALIMPLSAPVHRLNAPQMHALACRSLLTWTSPSVYSIYKIIACAWTITTGSLESPALAGFSTRTANLRSCRWGEKCIKKEKDGQS